MQNLSVYAHSSKAKYNSFFSCYFRNSARKPRKWCFMWALIHFYCSLYTFCSFPGTFTSTTLNLWNQNHSLNFQSWNDCKSVLFDISPKIIYKCSSTICDRGKKSIKLVFYSKWFLQKVWLKLEASTRKDIWLSKVSAWDSFNCSEQ